MTFQIREADGGGFELVDHDGLVYESSPDRRYLIQVAQDNLHETKTRYREALDEAHDAQEEVLAWLALLKEETGIEVDTP